MKLMFRKFHKIYKNTKKLKIFISLKTAKNIFGQHLINYL
jgi:hypothetical protein